MTAICPPETADQGRSVAGWTDQSRSVERHLAEDEAAEELPDAVLVLEHVDDGLDLCGVGTDDA
jgi:hypothetical protein